MPTTTPGVATRRLGELAAGHQDHSKRDAHDQQSLSHFSGPPGSKIKA
jgi:hypothetical protein